MNKIFVSMITTTIILGLVSSGLCQTPNSSTTHGLEKAWKLDVKGFGLDPSTWSVALKARMAKVGIGGAYAMSLGFPLAQAVGVMLLLFGLVNLDWALLAMVCASLYGWRRGNKVFLCLGLSLAYCLAFGYNMLG